MSCDPNFLDSTSRMSTKNLSQLNIFHLKQGNNKGLLVVGITV